MKLSIVATLYASASHIDEFCERVLRAAAAVTDDCEVILVNDASPDESVRIALAWHARDARIRVLDLSRHYGHYPAILAGLSRSRGERVFLIDVDLEEPPELLGRFWSAMDADPELDVVVGVQQERRGGWWERASGAAFYRLLNLGTEMAVLPDTLVARLMTRRFVDALVALPERPVSLDILSAAAGFRQLAAPAQKSASSATTYSFVRKLNLATRAVILHHPGLPWYVALVAAVMGVMGVGLIGRAIATDGAADRPLIIGSIWLVGAMLMAALSVIAHYLVLLLDEVRRRPTLVRREYTRE
jgi:putative glycosyltransferase